jgi:hypothetical protein
MALKLPETFVFEMQPYGVETLGDLREMTDNAGHSYITGTVLEGTETARLFQHTTTRSTKGARRWIYGITQRELDAGRAIRIAAKLSPMAQAVLSILRNGGEFICERQGAPSLCGVAPAWRYCLFNRAGRLVTDGAFRGFYELHDAGLLGPDLETRTLSRRRYHGVAGA